MHHEFLRRCMELAEYGRGHVSPNPIVGCVIVSAGAVITEGWHAEFGGAHAEVSALRRAGDLARGATLYVNLEPCSTHGKQPPCTNAILRAGIRTVVFGAKDVSSKGLNVLKLKGLEVIGPILEVECRRQNRGFFSALEQGRPWVTVKKAITKNGRVKNTKGKPRLMITDEEQDIWAHEHLRAMHDAILVGSGTIIADDPQLTVRTNNYQLTTNNLRRPWRIILDPHHTIPRTAKVLSDSDADRTIVIREKLPISELLAKIKDMGIASVLIEGGPKVWQSFEQSGLYDEIVILAGK